jgi:hypothetical protein
MIEFIETYDTLGNLNARLKADGMPSRCNAQDYTYTITVFESGSAYSKSRACGNGSVRHHVFMTYAEAQEHAIKWAKRMIAKERVSVERRAKDAAELEAHQAANQA